MDTKEKMNVGVGEAALTMAIGIIIERAQRLSSEDQKDFYKLVNALETAKDAEDLQAIRMAMMEILDQEPCGITRMDLPNRPAKLQRWVEYVAQKVRQLRKQAKLTQVELAKKSGLPQSHISRIEAAKLSPSQATLEKIAKAMGRLLSDLDPSA
jgi:ribosome-binding protein aMBF1 (putative translation factor)